MPESPRDRTYVFGPVPSRRLGRSLGVDLVPFKTCTYDCIYCQLGPTTRKTLARKEWVPTREVLEQVGIALVDTSPDWVTLSGSGEPTLHAELGAIVDGIKSMTDVPLALLTNGSLLGIPEVRDAAVNVDLVMPSLDAGTEEGFRNVNRPHEDLVFDDIVEGLVSLRDHYRGDIWLEVFLLAGLTATESEVTNMIRLAERIRADRIQLNTISRPPCEAYAFPVPEDQMQRYAARFGANAEVIADFEGVHERAEFVAGRSEVLELIRHRPCTLDDIAGGLGIHINEVVKYLEELLSRGDARAIEQAGKTYYTAVQRREVRDGPP